MARSRRFIKLRDERVVLAVLRKARDRDGEQWVDSFELRAGVHHRSNWMRVVDRLRGRGFEIEVERVYRSGDERFAPRRERRYRDPAIWRARLVSEPEPVRVSEPGSDGETWPNVAGARESACSGPVPDRLFELDGPERTSSAIAGEPL